MRKWLAVVLAVGLCATVTVAAYATDSDYYTRVVSGSAPSQWSALGAGLSGNATPSWSEPIDGGSTSRTITCGGGTCFHDNSVPNGDVLGSVGLTGADHDNGYILVPGGSGGGGGGAPIAFAFWFKPSADSSATSLTLQTGSGRNIYTDDHWAHLRFGGATVAWGTGEIGKWHMLTVVSRGDGNLDLWDAGTRIQRVSGSWDTGGQVTFGGDVVSSSHSYRGSFYGYGEWLGAAATALEKDRNGCDPDTTTGCGVTLIAGLYSGISCPTGQHVLASGGATVNPDGTTTNTGTTYKCVPDSGSGTGSTCTSESGGAGGSGGTPCAPVGQVAPLSGSSTKYQLGYLGIGNCSTFPTVSASSFFGLSLTIPDPIGVWPWIWCNVSNAIARGINAVVLAANVIIDLILPDWQGAVELGQVQTDLLHRGPFAYYTAYSAAFGAVLADGAMTAGSNLFMTLQVAGHGYTFDIIGLLSPIAPWRTGMGAAISATTAIGLLMAVRRDLAGGGV